MTYANPDALVSTEWLADHLSAPDVRVVDASWFLPGSDRDPRREYESHHIPGAVFFDVDEIADTTSPLPHMLPDPVKFASRVKKLGLGNGLKVVIYDQAGGAMAAARVWWMFRAMGHKEVAVLDGGLQKWLREGRPTEDLPPMPRERHFLARFNNTLVRNADQVKALLDSRREQLVDARGPGRFDGTDPEPRPAKRLGHIPGARNLPWAALQDPETLCMLPAEQIKAKAAAAGIDPSKPLVVSCGTGITACYTALALHLIGAQDVAVYDGSWAEWGDREDLPVETGAASA